MTTALWGLFAAIATALAAVITAKITSGGAVRAAEVPVRLEMEAEAFANAAAYWKETIAGLKSDIGTLNSKVDSLVEREEASERREQTLTERVRILEQTLADNNIPVPPWHVNS